METKVLDNGILFTSFERNRERREWAGEVATLVSKISRQRNSWSNPEAVGSILAQAADFFLFLVWCPIFWIVLTLGRKIHGFTLALKYTLQI